MGMGLRSRAFVVQVAPLKHAAVDQFRYIKIQPKTIDLSTRLRGITIEFVEVYSPEPRAEVYCVRLNFNISKLVYCVA